MAVTGAIAVISASVQYYRFGATYLPGDSFYYAGTAESLLRDGDFALANQLGVTTRDDLRAHEGFFAVSPDGRVVPKHSVLLPIISIPFVALLGTIGFLVVNGIVAVALVTGVAFLGGNDGPARIAALILFITSSWLGYCFNYSPDLFLSLLIVWSYAAAKHRRWLLSGLLAGLAVWAKVYAALIVLPLGLLILPAGRRAILLAASGALFGVLPMLILNTMLYGGPFVTGYDRDARVTAEGFTLTEHYSRFHQPFVRGLIRVLFDWPTGMIRTAPLWFLWPIGLFLLRRERWAWAAAAGAVINVGFFAPYDEWNASTGGNRFLFPAVALGGALLAPLFSTFGMAKRQP